MTYSEAVDYLLGQLPMYQRIGPAAYKANLDNTISLSAHLGHPEKKIKHIHIAGTNGKGSVAHMLASVFQEQGWKTGLATSPHLKDYRERIKINGKKIPKHYVAAFVGRHMGFFNTLNASFFEISIALTFKYFFDEQVDIAVVETGLGGRLDSTNIILPEVSVITNIGYDHTSLLGETLPEIAKEKAGIIKKGIPVVVGSRQQEVHQVFEEVAGLHQSPLIVADECIRLKEKRLVKNGSTSFLEFDVELTGKGKTRYQCGLTGAYQSKNILTSLAALHVLDRYRGLAVSEKAIQSGLLNVVKNTGLKGRWQYIRKRPRVICDTGHNADGITAVIGQLQSIDFRILRIVFGMVQDKDIHGILRLLPKDAVYYFCAPDLPRAVSAESLALTAQHYGLAGQAFNSVRLALTKAIGDSSDSDLIFVGGSNFVVAEVV